MTITRDSLKILKSEDIGDYEDSGGRVTTNEVVDGKSNDLFLDIPQTSRAYGDVDLVKVFPSVVTDSNEPLLGGIFTIGDLPEDDSVNITAFSTKDWFDKRKDAVKHLEGYLAPAPEIEGRLLEKQLVGQRAIQLIMEVDGTPPAIGKSLYLVENEDTLAEFSQYVRVAGLKSEMRNFRYNGASLKKKVVTVELTTKLSRTFTGTDINRYEEGIKPSAICRDTRVADTAEYYTTKPLKEDVLAGEAMVKVDDIFTKIVPSAESEIPLGSGINVVGNSTALVPAGKDLTVTIPNYLPTSTQNLFMGNAIYPGTLRIKHGSTDITESGGQLFINSNAVGAVNYDLSIISWLPAFNPSRAQISITFKPSASPTVATKSMVIKVTEGNRGFVWAITLLPIPSAGSLKVSYITQGNTYILKDTGAGELLGSDENYGSGTVNNSTGDVLVSLGAEPDLNSFILFTWAADAGFYDVSDQAPKHIGFKTPMPKPTDPLKSLALNSITVDWNDGTPRQAVADNFGVLSGDATGYWDNEALYIEPAVLPPKDTVFNISHRYVTKQSNDFTGAKSVSIANGSQISFTLDSGGEQIIKGSLNFDLYVGASTGEYDYFGGTILGKRTFAVIDKDVGTGVGALYFKNRQSVQIGTINYTNNLVNIDVSSVVETIYELEYPSYTSPASQGIYRSA